MTCWPSGRTDHLYDHSRGYAVGVCSTSGGNVKIAALPYHEFTNIAESKVILDCSDGAP